jgi:hypothetical protein
MLTIGHLQLALPPGFGPRGRRIARLVGDELAALSLPSGSRRVDRLVVRPVEVGAGATDAEVAAAIGRAVSAQLHRHAGGEP